ncbi:hypothetical protein CON65_19330 [Bacillus pseudomycoides]|uniref:Uncharacterized protein n=1 Tax=Bacillus pseudomycoides TaxID=64104 RepID=A0AA91VA35_9BACI|nr:hypothetical protein COO03_21840 [Bacillus sp. AFS098217]PED81034.1 hypothetical protein CON65_19330 [Bacillus pseudomycoides]PEU05456.1 hypothetical protein CN524_25475 [Bacillus sp. AFS019443]PEU18055.1 hypothetical protein CN525_13255 [Bacillus sp. AFS014408]PFW62200.1 hypothetical protein COL20_13995 [Bacillus sp. AFS075034]
MQCPPLFQTHSTKKKKILQIIQILFLFGIVLPNKNKSNIHKTQYQEQKIMPMNFLFLLDHF